MQKIAIIPVGEKDSYIVSTLQSQLNATIIERAQVRQQWKQFNAFIFIGAMGICVRTIAPLVEDKHTDPAVVCVDTLRQFAVSVLSGHIGGANELTRQVASMLRATPVITTQSDNAGLWALDTLEKRFDWAPVFSQEEMNAAIYTFVNRRPTALYMDVRDEGTDYLERTLPSHVAIIHDIKDAIPSKYALLIIVSPRTHHYPEDMLTLHFVPMVGTIGFGLAHHPDNIENIYDEINDTLYDCGFFDCSHRFCTIDVKRDEPFVGHLKFRYQKKVEFFTADELAQVEVPHPNDTVAKLVGTPSVCEAAAILGSDHGELVVAKVKGEKWTAALAINRRHLRSVPQQGHIEIVGAGPGDPDLISVRGRRMLEQADLILYAGSLVPKALTSCHKPTATVLSSAPMSLEEQCTLMKEHYNQGHFIVRLHTGDPCIFGAIQEQMAFFDRHGMSYHITPGISSFLAAAAELRSQFTIPERTQTIILTRGEGRTPMPEKEQLHLLAKSQSTMCIFLSAAIVDDVQKELLQEYPEDTPVAACYHLTWPDQHIYRGQLKDLANIVHENNLTLTTMIVVGEAIDNRHGLSELYNKHFTHLFRKGTE